MLGRPFAPRRYHQGAVGEGDENTGRNHVDPVRPYFGPWLDLFDRHSGRFGKNFRQHTVVAWVEMLHQHKRHSGIGWQRMKNSVYASRPPAEAPMATIGNGAFGAGVFSRRPFLPWDTNLGTRDFICLPFRWSWPVRTSTLFGCRIEEK
jgi:hypothetical protein